MRLWVVLLVISAALGAEPAVITIKEPIMTRAISDFSVSLNEVSGVAGILINNITGLNITVSAGRLMSYNLTLTRNGVETELSHTFNDNLIQVNTALLKNDLVKLNFTSKQEAGTHLIRVDFTSRLGSESIESALVINEDIKPFVINQSSWIQGQAIVGRQVAWLSIVKVFNPNNLRVKEFINCTLLPESFRTQVTINNNRVSLDDCLWEDELGPLEEKEYLITSLTTPVIEESIETSLFNISESQAFIINELMITNPSKNDYYNVTLNLGLKKDNIININCNCSINNNSIVFPLINNQSSSKVIVEYLDKPPILIVTPRARNFEPGSVINLSIILIPEKTINGLNLEIEVISDGNTVFADIISRDVVSVGSNFYESINFKLDNSPTGNYTVIVTARDNLDVINTAENWFAVQQEREPIETIMIIIIIIIIIVILKLLFS